MSPNTLLPGEQAISKKMKALDLATKMLGLANELGLNPYITIPRTKMELEGTPFDAMLSLDCVFILIENIFDDSRLGCTITTKYWMGEEGLHKDYLLFWEMLREDETVIGGRWRRTIITPQNILADLDDKKNKSRSGRPHYTDDVWAWEQIYIYERPNKEVYNEWKEKLEKDPIRKDLVNPKDQWKRISKLKWGDKLGK